uniref:ATP synthase subunit a n=1 Tax=Saphonecrus sp. ZJUH 20220015 TaxID=2943460 RepID=A0A9E8G9D7_9HYME|nr:ATP synthase F0 subunit 6 [Saphonecrus sp. ZJUH 20220015]
MMSNLFSIFDPSTSLNFSLNWLSPLLSFLFIPKNFWLHPSKYIILWEKMSQLISLEMKVSLKNKENYLNQLMFKTMFIFILLSNFITLFPYIFNSTSHLTLSLMMSMSLWLSFMLFGWIKNMTHMFIHLLPQGTPFALMPFMVMIETTSNIIRPLTLSIRLSANIIAGHLLMTLISSTMINLSTMLIIVTIMIQSILVLLEIAVSFIQSYVFTILTSLYLSETNN